MSLMNEFNVIQKLVALVQKFALLKFIKPIERKIFNINDPIRIKMLT